MAFKTAILFLTLLSSTLVLSLPQPSLRTRSDCQHTTTTINGKIYTTSCNVDRPGGDFTLLQTDSLDSCISACSSYDTQCKSATYVSATGFCYLKDTLTYESLANGDSTVTLGTGCQARNNIQLNGRTCSTACGIDYHGFDFQALQAGSFEACVQACAADDKCLTAQYRESTGFCYLKETVSSSVSDDSDVESVFCDEVAGSSTTTTTSTASTTATTTTEAATTTTATATTTASTTTSSSE